MDGGPMVLQHPVVPAEHSNGKTTIENIDVWVQNQLSDPIFRCPELMATERISCKVNMTSNGGSYSEAEQTGMLLVKQPQPQPKTKDTLVGGRHASGLNSLLPVDHPLKDSAASLNLGMKRKLDGAMVKKCAIVDCGDSALAAADAMNKIALLPKRNNAWLQLNDGTSSNLAPTIISLVHGDVRIRDLGGEKNVVSGEMFFKGSRSTIERSGSKTEETNMLQVLVQLPLPQTQQQQQQQQGTLNEGSNTSGLSSLPCEVGASKASAVSALQMVFMAICAINCESVDSGRLAANDVQGNTRCLNVTLPQLWAISEPGEPEHDSKAALRMASSLMWLIATAAPHHATGNRALLSGYTPERGDLFLQAAVANGGAAAPMRVLGRGAVVTDAVELPDVWYVPGLAANLVSVGQLAELGYSVAFGRGTCRVTGAGADVVGEARAGEGGVFELDFLRVPLNI